MLRVLDREGLNDDRREPLRLEQLELPPRLGDQPGRELRLEHFPRVRREGERHRFAVTPGLGEQRLVAQMHAIEVAQTHGSPRERALARLFQ